MTPLERFVFSFFNADVAARYWPDILQGFLLTTYLGLAVIAAGIPLGLLLASIRSFRWLPVNALIVVFADVFRALPPLMVIIILFFAFPYIDVSMNAFVATWIALTLVLAAFAEEIFWRASSPCRTDSSRPRAPSASSAFTDSSSSCCRRRCGSRYPRSPTA